MQHRIDRVQRLHSHASRKRSLDPLEEELQVFPVGREISQQRHRRDGQQISGRQVAESHPMEDLNRYSTNSTVEIRDHVGYSDIQAPVLGGDNRMDLDGSDSILLGSSTDEALLLPMHQIDANTSSSMGESPVPTNHYQDGPEMIRGPMCSIHESVLQRQNSIDIGNIHRDTMLNYPMDHLDEPSQTKYRSIPTHCRQQGSVLSSDIELSGTQNKAHDRSNKESLDSNSFVPNIVLGRKAGKGGDLASSNASSRGPKTSTISNPLSTEHVAQPQIRSKKSATKTNSNLSRGVTSARAFTRIKHHYSKRTSSAGQPQQQRRKEKVHVSGVWNYFTRIKKGEDNLAACNACLWTTKLHSSSTSNLRRHLSTRHQLSREDISLEIGALTQKRNGEGDKSTNKLKKGGKGTEVSAIESFQRDAERLKLEREVAGVSVVWKHFKRVEMQKEAWAVCDICNWTTKVYDWSTSNLQRHLTGKHKLVLGSRSSTSNAASKSKAVGKEVTQSNGQQSRKERPGEASIRAGKASTSSRKRVRVNEEEIRTSSTKQARAVVSSKHIDDEFLSNLGAPDFASMLSVLRFLTSQSDPEVLQSIRASKTVMEARVKAFIEGSCNSGVALSFDSWSEHVLPGHISVSAHWIDGQWMRRSVIISCVQRTTAVDLAFHVLGDLKSFSLLHRVVAICSNDDSVISDAVAMVVKQCSSQLLPKTSGKTFRCTLLLPKKSIGGESVRSKSSNENKKSGSSGKASHHETGLGSGSSRRSSNTQMPPFRLSCLAHAIFSEIENCQHFSYEECGKLFDLLDLWHRVPELHDQFEAQKRAAKIEGFGVAPEDTSYGVDVNSPWHKKYGVLYGLLDQRELLEATCKEIKNMDLGNLDIDFEPYILTDKDWAMVKLTVEFFRLGVTMARLESAVSPLTIGMLPTLHRELVSQCNVVQAIARDECSLPPGNRLSRAVSRIAARLEGLSKSIQTEFVNDAVLLDPRVSCVQNATGSEADEQVHRARLLELLTLSGYRREVDEVFAQQSAAGRSGTGKKAMMHSGPGLSGRTDEEVVDAFRRIKLDQGMDILSWWKSNHSRFPRLAEVAREVLPVSCFSYCSAVTDHEEVNRIPLLLGISDFDALLGPGVLTAAFLVRSWDLVLRTVQSNQ